MNRTEGIRRHRPGALRPVPHIHPLKYHGQPHVPVPRLTELEFSLLFPIWSLTIPPLRITKSHPIPREYLKICAWWGWLSILMNKETRHSKMLRFSLAHRRTIWFTLGWMATTFLKRTSFYARWRAFRAALIQNRCHPALDKPEIPPSNGNTGNADTSKDEVKTQMEENDSDIEVILVPSTLRLQKSEEKKIVRKLFGIILWQFFSTGLK